MRGVDDSRWGGGARGKAVEVVVRLEEGVAPLEVIGSTWPEAGGHAELGRELR